MSHKTKFKVIIAGGRLFNDYKSLKIYLDYLFQNKTNVEIVSGGARGADKLGEKYAKEHKIPFVIFEAEWDRLGKSAGIQRNNLMAAYADALVAFWDGKSRGTKHMIEYATSKGLQVKVKQYD